VSGADAEVYANLRLTQPVQVASCQLDNKLTLCLTPSDKLRAVTLRQRDHVTVQHPLAKQTFFWMIFQWKKERNGNRLLPPPTFSGQSLFST
jgi:hypothetical protein